jgi:hypothetical protein
VSDTGPNVGVFVNLDASICARDAYVSKKGRVSVMDTTRCPACKRRLIAMTDGTGRTQLRCLICEDVDPIRTVATKWADEPLATPLQSADRPAGPNR